MTRKILLLSVAAVLLVGALAVWSIAKGSTGITVLDSGQSPIGIQPPQLRQTFGGGQSAGLGNPLAVTGSAGEVYVADALRGRLLVFNRDGGFVRTLGEPGNLPGQLRYPYGVAIHGQKVYVADMGASAILVFDPEGEFLGTFGSPGILNKPTDIEFYGDRLYVADAGLHQVLVIGPEGNILERIGGPGEGVGQLRYPNGVALGDTGTLYVADSGNNRVQVFDPAGRFLKVIQSDEKTGVLLAPRGIALDQHGTLYVVSGLQNAIVAFDKTGNEVFRLMAPAGSREALYLPTGLYVDSEGRVYVTESGNRRVSVFW